MVLFLDGLDEVHPKDGALGLLDVVESIVCSQGLVGTVKMCLGARREPLIERRLCVCPQLRLQDLNGADLRRFAEDNVRIPPDYRITMFPDAKVWFDIASHDFGEFSCKKLPTRQQIRDWLVAELVRKAAGVFLWLSHRQSDHESSQAGRDRCGLEAASRQPPRRPHRPLYGHVEQDER